MSVESGRGNGEGAEEKDGEGGGGRNSGGRIARHNIRRF